MIFDLVDSLIRRVFLLFINLLIRNNLQSHFEFIDRIRIIFERDRIASRVNDRFIFHQTFAFFQSNSRVLRSFDQLPPPFLSNFIPPRLEEDERRILKRGGGGRERKRGRKENSEKKFHWGDCDDAFLRFRPFRFDVFSTYFDASFFPKEDSPQTRTLLDHAFSRHNLS